ncbi:MAG: hypothetical protein EHM34_06405 [Nitrosopumilales archaeon]|nr:MAG: hypothetical protein EHM34_06405 [Nitrosopumilales archaeon]
MSGNLSSSDGSESNGKKVVYEYDLTIKHYEGDQTYDELNKPCEGCLLKTRNFSVGSVDKCRLYNLPTRECLRMCISNYRVDDETFIDAMRRKMECDAQLMDKWIKSFSDYVEPEDGSIHLIKNPDDIIPVIKDLEDLHG